MPGKRSGQWRDVVVMVVAVFGVLLSAMSEDSVRAAEPQTSSSAGQEVEYRAGGETVKAYLAVPSEGEARGSVIVAHEWWGLNKQIRTVADRLAASGFLAIVPDLYRGQVAADPEQAHELMRGLQESRASSILRDTASYLRASGKNTDLKAASLGFCMGGRLALMAALDGHELSAVVMYYGRPVLEEDRLQSLEAPVLGLFGAEDRGIPEDDVRAFESALRRAGKKIDVRIYEGAGHAFFNDTRSSYNSEAASDAWSRTLVFLEKTLAQ